MVFEGPDPAKGTRMARFSSRGSRRNRRLLNISRRQYIIATVIGVVALAMLLHRSRSSTPQPAAAQDSETTGQAVNPAATALNTTQAIRKLAANLEAAPSASAAPSGPVALAAPQTVPAPNPAVDTAISQARELSSQPGQILAARDKLSGVLSMAMATEQLRAAKEQLSELADKWLFSSTVCAGDSLCDTYLVQPGDNLEAIGRRYKVPYETLMHINRIPDARNLQAGQRIKVIHGPFHVRIYRSTFTLDLYLQNTFVRSFKVALGAPGNETPTGSWRVQAGGKLVQPPWYDKRANRSYQPTDPDYPLGARWIELDGLDGDAKGRTGFAIHGTKDPDSIGKQVSQGCVRMNDRDVILLYDLLYPIASKVEISD
jgi:lipoprotein-anchoring transpeptidase ErfK/SrfK